MFRRRGATRTDGGGRPAGCRGTGEVYDARDAEGAPLTALLLAWVAAAHAWTAEELRARLDEVQEQRALRIHPAAPTAADADLRKVAAGTVVTGLAADGKAYGYAIVDVGIAKFWAGLNDETRHPGYTPVTYSELLSGKLCGSGRRVLQFLPVPMLDDRWWIGVLTPNGKLQSASGGAVRELAWSSSVDPAEVTSESGKKMIAQGVPIGFSKGAWFLVALDERTTYLEYFLHSDPGGGIPSGMASMFATKGVRESISAITRYAKEAKPSCPIE